MIVEVCVDCLESVVACAEAGADRIELCAGLVEGGTTPSAGFLCEARKAFLGKIMMMVRPRGGDFHYTSGEAEVMLEDIRVARQGGADGVVFGCLTPAGEIDGPLVERLVAEAGEMDITFHRAFDVTCNLGPSLETLIALGIPRVLTSGGKPSVPQGLSVLADLVRQAAGRITILPGGGVTADAVGEIVAATGVQEIHLSARRSVDSRMEHRRPDIPMGASAVPGEYDRRVADPALIRLAKSF